MGMLYDLIFGVFALTALAAFLGNYLDNKLSISPVLSISFGIIAIIVGLARMVIKANEIGEKQSINKNKEKNNGS